MRGLRSQTRCRSHGRRPGSSGGNCRTGSPYSGRSLTGPVSRYPPATDRVFPLVLPAFETLPVSAGLDIFQDLPRVTMALDLPVAHHVAPVGIQVVKDVPCMGDDKPAFFPFHDMRFFFQ